MIQPTDEEWKTELNPRAPLGSLLRDWVIISLAFASMWVLRDYAPNPVGTFLAAAGAGLIVPRLALGLGIWIARRYKADS